MFSSLMQLRFNEPWDRRSIGLWVVALVAFLILSHWPSSQSRLSMDDYLNLHALKGSNALAEYDLAHPQPRPFEFATLADTYHFFNTNKGTVDSQRAYGNIPWWGVEEGRMHPLRPLAALTHYLDYVVLDLSEQAMFWHSLIWFLLFALAALRFYSLFSPQFALALLAVLLLTVDLSAQLNFRWIAGRNAFMALAFALNCLFYYVSWRRSGKVWFLALALFWFVLSIFTAEASIAILGYMGAYALTLDRRHWFKACLAVLPFFVIMLMWRYGYNIGEYGAKGIGLYADPGADLKHFLQQLVLVLPMIFTSLLSGIDALMPVFGLQQRWIIQLAAVLVLLVLGIVVWLIQKDNKTVRFFALGALMAAVPMASLLSAGPRSGTFVAIGFFYCMAVWLLAVFSAQKLALTTRVLAIVVLAYHLLLPSVIGLAYPLYAKATNLRDAQQLFKVLNPLMIANPDRSLVIVNIGLPIYSYYLPLEMAREYPDVALPKRLQLLAPGLNQFTLTRIADRRFEISSAEGLVVHQNVPLLKAAHQQTALFDLRNGHSMAQGLITQPSMSWQVGQDYRAGDLFVSIKSSRLSDGIGVPTNITIEFLDDEPLASKAWLMFDWDTLRYHQLDVLALGESRQFKGAFDSVSR